MIVADRDLITLPSMAREKFEVQKRACCW
jgi:hypothetical protein